MIKQILVAAPVLAPVQEQFYSKIVWLMLVSFIFNPLNAVAFKFTPEICQKYNLGKNWYCEAEKIDAKQDELSSSDIMNSNLAPEEKATQLSKLWEVQRQRAVITSDRGEIEKFLKTHNLIINKGIEFAKNTQSLIEASPVLAVSNSYYKNMHEQSIKEQEQMEILQNAHLKYGIVFIYSSSCPHCHNQLPILKMLKEKYQFKVMGISVDENHFEDLDENITDERISNDPLVQAFPTILLLDKKHPAKIFISKGLTTIDELEIRIASRIGEREYEQK